jgi:hypothetical protein
MRLKPTRKLCFMVLLARKLHSQHHHRPRFEVDTADSPKDDESDKESDTKLVEDEDIEEWVIFTEITGLCQGWRSFPGSGSIIFWGQSV